MNTLERCHEYIRKLAERDGAEYSLEPTQRNWDALDQLTDLCIAADESSAERHQAALRALCAEVLSLSTNLVTVQQGVKHTEPDDLEPYRILFGYGGATVNMRDVKYKPLEPQPVVLQFNVESDDEDVLRLTPGTQLSLFSIEGV